MDPLCELCGVVRAVVYCKPDSARLCLDCDVCVHAANALSCRHPRYPLCGKCNCQPAIVHCLDNKLSLCQCCDWDQHNCLLLGHKHQTLNCYTGCPSFTEFPMLLSYVLDATSSDGSDHGGGSLNTLQKNDSCISKCLEQLENGSSFDLVSNKLNEKEPCAKYEPWMEQASTIPSNPNYKNISKEHSNVNDLLMHDEDDLSMESILINFENSAEMFDCSQIATKNHFDNGGMGCELKENNISISESNTLIKSVMEESSPIHHDYEAFQSFRTSDSTSVMLGLNGNTNCVLMHPCFNDNINKGFPQGQDYSSISLSLPKINGEINGTDYQDSELPPMFMVGESPWESNLEGTCPQAREKAKMRYNEKKKTRRFGKQIRYASRKARADTRKRVKGRFVKVNDASDCDPQGAGDF
ncbi:CCT domain [Sesbania bispinosa]|nr:CCT domain [Sesbania bispinosa]